MCVYCVQIEQLHMCLKGSKCAILSGPSGSGKTMSYSTLAAAYQYIRELRALGKSSKSSKHSNRFENTGQYEEYPITDVTVLNPAVYSYEEVCTNQQCTWVVYACIPVALSLSCLGRTWTTLKSVSINNGGMGFSPEYLDTSSHWKQAAQHPLNKRCKLHF